jgi:hypothetical protein
MVVAINEKFKTNAILDDSIKLAKAVDSIPEWVEVDFDNRSAKFSRLPNQG